jgi:hypothetical protein
MSLSGERLAELRRAYQVLGVPPEGTAHVIRQAYRRLVKRWHPDLYPIGSKAHTEATEMTKRINEAYAAIAQAPLRYYVERTHGEETGRAGQTRWPRATQTIRVTFVDFRRPDRLEFWVRFVCGGVFGMVLTLAVIASEMPDSVPHPALLVLGILILVLACAFGSARYGDKFWYSRMRHRMFWP